MTVILGFFDALQALAAVLARLSIDCYCWTETGADWGTFGRDSLSYVPSTLNTACEVGAHAYDHVFN